MENVSVLSHFKFWLAVCGMRTTCEVGRNRVCWQRIGSVFIRSMGGRRHLRHDLGVGWGINVVFMLNQGIKYLSGSILRWDTSFCPSSSDNLLRE